MLGFKGPYDRKQNVWKRKGKNDTWFNREDAVICWTYVIRRDGRPYCRRRCHSRRSSRRWCRHCCRSGCGGRFLSCLRTAGSSCGFKTVSRLNIGLFPDPVIIRSQSNIHRRVVGGSLAIFLLREDSDSNAVLNKRRTIVEIAWLIHIIDCIKVLIKS